MDEKTLSTLEHAFDYVIELKVAEQEKRFQKYLRVIKSPLISYVSDLVPYEVVPSGISLRTEIVREFEGLKNNAKMMQNGVIDFLGLRMFFIPSEASPLLTKMLIEKYDYEAGYNLTRSLGEGLANVLFKNFTNLFKFNNLEEGVAFYTRIATLMGLGQFSIQQYNPENGVIRIRIENSPVCTRFKNSGKEMGAFMEGVIQGTMGIYFGPKSNCKEVKCVAKGDEYCEYLVTFPAEKT
jgi:predicted hydrocarbon binding protein